MKRLAIGTGIVSTGLVLFALASLALAGRAQNNDNSASRRHTQPPVFVPPIHPPFPRPPWPTPPLFHSAKNFSSNRNVRNRDRARHGPHQADADFSQPNKPNHRGHLPFPTADRSLPSPVSP
jgi:hypothetical protein